MKIFNPKKTKLFKTKYLPNHKMNMFKTQKYYINIKKEIPKPTLDKIPNFLLKKKTYRFIRERKKEKNKYRFQYDIYNFHRRNFRSIENNIV